MPNHNELNLSGLIQGRLKVLYKLPKKTGERIKYKCLCYCGNFCEYETGQIRHTVYPRQSCGRCYDAEKYKAEYHVWEAMLGRCYNKNGIRYQNYGGRGITVCQRWRQDFLFFLEDMGFRPSTIHSIERIDVNGNYEPSNCKWLLNIFQQLNKTTSKD